MRVSLLIGTVLLCSAADAQISQIPFERYYPLSPGDVRVYEHRSGSGTTCQTELVRYELNEVLRDTVVAGEPRSVASCTLFSPDGGRIGRNVYVVRRTGPLSVDGTVLNENGGCSLFSSSGGGQPREEIDTPVTIGGTAYVVPGQFSVSVVGSGAGGTSQSYSARSYADIGPGGQFSRTQRGSPSMCNQSETNLVYADVSGRVYGANPFTVGDTPPAGTRVALTASPSPASGSATLRIAAETGGEVRVEAFDLLGRRIYTAEAQPGVLRLDVSLWPAGLYVVRATAGGEAVTARLVVSR